jgi:SAM-dependent methyltransferase
MQAVRCTGIESTRLSQFKDHFSDLASQYAASRPGYSAPLFDYLAGLCPERQAAWDCACGSGQAAVPLADHFETVYATDASKEQVASATPHPRVRYSVAPAEHSGLEAQSVNLVTVAQALHWFDLPKFYAEVDRVLKDNGVLAVWTYSTCTVEGPEADALAQKFYSETIGPYWPPERRIVESGYRDLPFPFTELTPPPLEMQESWPLGRLLGYFRSWSATGRYIKQHGVDPVVTLGEALEKVWGDPMQSRRITWRLFVRVSRKSPPR